MISLVVKQQTTNLVVYMDIDKIAVTKTNPSLDCYIGPETIKTTRRSVSVYVHDDTKIYVEPFVYIDGGLYDSEGTIVDAEYYNTAYWAVTWNGGYV